ncbi:MAG: hypothetical protein K8H87_16080, partial [Pseudorhodoplanes sp.]|nr:hypothetical protein [Pseudorhodoplanes sp.]
MREKIIPPQTTGAKGRPVTREPDPRIRRKKKRRRKMRDCRVKPGNDSADRSRSNTLGIRPRTRFVVFRTILRRTAS